MAQMTRMEGDIFIEVEYPRPIPAGALESDRVGLLVKPSMMTAEGQPIEGQPIEGQEGHIEGRPDGWHTVDHRIHPIIKSMDSQDRLHGHGSPERKTWVYALVPIDRNPRDPRALAIQCGTFGNATQKDTVDKLTHHNATALVKVEYLVIEPIIEREFVSDLVGKAFLEICEVLVPSYEGVVHLIQDAVALDRKLALLTSQAP